MPRRLVARARAKTCLIQGLTHSAAAAHLGARITLDKLVRLVGGLAQRIHAVLEGLLVLLRFGRVARPDLGLAVEVQHMGISSQALMRS